MLYIIYYEFLNCFVVNFIGLGYFICGKVLLSELVDMEIGVICGDWVYFWLKDFLVDILFRLDDILLDIDSEL